MVARVEVHQPVALAERPPSDHDSLGLVQSHGYEREEEPEFAEGTLVRPPVAAHPTASSRKTLTPKKRSRSSRAAVPIRLSVAPPLPMRMPFCGVVLHEDARADVEALRPLPFRELLDPHRAGVGHFLVGETKDLLADGLGDPEGLRLIGQRLRGKYAGRSGMAATIRSSSRSRFSPFPRRRARSPGRRRRRGTRRGEEEASPWAPRGQSC